LGGGGGGLIDPERQEIVRGWETLQNEELHNLKCSANIIRMMKSRTIRLVEQFLHVGDMK
jgi:hypothetical protein